MDAVVTHPASADHPTFEANEGFSYCDETYSILEYSSGLGLLSKNLLDVP